MMGLHNWSGSCADSYGDKYLPTKNPNPKNYVILDSEAIGPFLILHIRYPDCTNYEGKKILVFQNTSLISLKKQGSIDPHFCNNPNYKSPIARFEPTNKGMDMAKIFCNAMNDAIYKQSILSPKKV